ncbi:threonylcarbamoyl-AMP synthase [candidate division WOR-3 bacterium]|nr:threonylcarbamoyl-AMP synthase [candidate division WOR-3 bacterium]
MILALDNNQMTVERVCTALRSGQIVALPTDTVYGFAVDGADHDAVDALARLKGRDTKPFVFFIRKNHICKYATITHTRIIERFMPGPLTAILKKRTSVELPRSTESIGIRIPDTPFIGKLLDAYEQPLAVTSANRAGEQPHTSPYDIAEQFKEVTLVLNNGTLISEPSTVLDLTHTPPTIERKGVVAIMSIEGIYGDLVRINPEIRFNVLFVCTGNSCRSPMAEAILRTLVDPAFCEIRSAGTLHTFGMSASEHANAVTREYGGTLTAHRSQPVTPALIMWADAIFCMSQKHLEHVRQLVPAAQSKVSLLKAYAGKGRNGEIADPVGQGLDAYKAVAQDMLPALRAIAQDITRRYQEDA